jgi:hypothetical protein
MAGAAVKLEINVEGLGQYNTSTCWLACYRMLYSWKRKDEKEIPGKIANAGLNYETLKKRGLLDEELPRAGTALGMIGRAAVAVRDYDIPTWVDRLNTGSAFSSKTRSTPSLCMGLSWRGGGATKTLNDVVSWG